MVGVTKLSPWGRIALVGVLGALASFACGQSASNQTKRGTASEGGDAGVGGTGGDPGVSGTGGRAGGGATGGDVGGTGTAGAGTSGQGGEGGSAGGGCGSSEVVPDAWYPIGDSAPAWPVRDATASVLALHRRPLPALSYDLLTPRLAVREGGLVAVSADCELYVRESGAWQWETPVQGFDDEGGAVDTCQVAIDRDGQLFFTHWNGDGRGFDGYAQRRTASGWDLLPGPFAAPDFHENGAFTSITFDAQNVLHLAWAAFNESDDTTAVQAVLFDTAKNTWQPIGPSPILPAEPMLGWTAPELSHGPSGELALLTSNFNDGTVVLEWNGNEWLDRTEAILDVEERLHLVHDDAGAPVAYAGSAETLLLFRWSGAQWDAVEPSESTLATLPERVRYDAWTDDDQVYVRRFGRCGWTGLSGSAEGGGVSNAPFGMAVSDPGLAVTDERVCVAWTEDDTDPVVLIRCHDLPSD